MGQFVRKTLAAGTNIEYKKGVAVFQEYIQDRGHDTMLKDAAMTGLTLQQQQYELTGLSLAMSERKDMTVARYDKNFAGVKRHMMEQGCDVQVFESPNLKEARQAGRIVVVKNRKATIEQMDEVSRKQHDDRYTTKLPFTEEMLMKCREKNWASATATILDKMSYVAIALGLHIGNRPGESSSNGPLAIDDDGATDIDHRFTTDNIRFQRETDHTWVTADGVTSENKDDFNFISVMVESHKGERIGKVKKAHREPNAVMRDGGGWETVLFEDMIDLTLLQKLNKGDFFFSRNEYKGRAKQLSNLKLQTKDIAARMKDAAVAVGVDKKYISPRSLRAGMASSLAKSGVDKSEINRLGRWAENSTASSKYVHAEHTRGALSGGGQLVSTLDISRMIK